MFKVSNPSESRGNMITAREILDKSSKEIDAGLGRDPELKAQMVDVMGNVYEGLGLYSRAESLLKEAVDIRTQVLGRKNLGTLNSELRLIWTVSQQGRYGEAEKMERELIATSGEVLGPNSRNTLLAQSDLAWILAMAARFREAENAAREAYHRQ